MNITKSPETAIRTQELRKQFDEEVTAVDGINLSIENNSIYALLGPNGAGKTTTISILSTQLKPTSGSALINGLDTIKAAGAVRNIIGVTFQEMVLDDDLTGRQVLDFHGRLYKQKKNERHQKIQELLQLVELDEAADRRCRTYSGGMKRRLELARGLLTKPKVLFLDEPTTGLDPQNRFNIWSYIRNLKERQGITILLTTHYMDEAEALADKVGIMDKGKIVIEGTPLELVEGMGADTILLSGNGDVQKFLKLLEELLFIDQVSQVGEFIQIGVDNGNKRLTKIVSAANDAGFIINDISVSKPNLGDVFLKYTGRQLRDI